MGNIATLNFISLNCSTLNIIGELKRKNNNYVPDDEIPNTHILFLDADEKDLLGADNHVFYCKAE